MRLLACIECVLTWICEQYLVVCNIAKWTILCIVVYFQPVIKLLQKGVSASQTCDFDAKMQIFLWGGGTTLCPDPSPSGEGDTPSPHPTSRRLRRLDLNPSHSEILLTLLTVLHGVMSRCGSVCGSVCLSVSCLDCVGNRLELHNLHVYTIPEAGNSLMWHAVQSYC